MDLRRPDGVPFGLANVRAETDSEGLAPRSVKGRRLQFLE